MVYQTLRRYFHQASLGDQSYRFLFETPPPDEVVAFDCETTGLDIRKDDIIAIAAVRIKRNRIQLSGRFDALSDALMTAMMYVVLRDLRKRGIRLPRERERASHEHLVRA